MISMYSVNRDLNKFIFLGEICDLRNNPWNKERVRQWLKKSGGKLSKNEKIWQCGAQYRYCSSPNYNFNLIQAYFLILKGNKLWETLNKELGIIKTKEFKKKFESFTDRFSLLWRHEKINLKKIKTYLYSQSKTTKSALAAVNNLVGINKTILSKKIPISLTISSNENRDQIGWFSILNNHVDLVVECSGVSEENYSFLNLIILHEYFHLALRKNHKIRRLIKDVSIRERILTSLSKDMIPEQILEELVISSFVPEGYLSLNYFDKKIKLVNSISKKEGTISFVLVRRLCAYKLSGLAKEYLNAKKPIDEKYLLALINVIKKG